jgi:hypothetical protein
MAAPSSAEERKYVNAHRFSWHEKVLADAELRRFPTALVLAGYIMHRFRADDGCAEISNESAGHALNMPSRSVIRAKQVLLRRGWIRPFDGARKRRKGWSASRYMLTGGPEDLLIDWHADSEAGSTDAGVTGGETT